MTHVLGWPVPRPDVFISQVVTDVFDDIMHQFILVNIEWVESKEPVVCAHQVKHTRVIIHHSLNMIKLLFAFPEFEPLKSAFL